MYEFIRAGADGAAHFEYDGIGRKNRTVPMWSVHQFQANGV